MLFLVVFVRSPVRNANTQPLCQWHSFLLFAAVLLVCLLLIPARSRASSESPRTLTIHPACIPLAFSSPPARARSPLCHLVCLLAHPVLLSVCCRVHATAFPFVFLSPLSSNKLCGRQTPIYAPCAREVRRVIPPRAVRACVSRKRGVLVAPCLPIRRRRGGRGPQQPRGRRCGGRCGRGTRGSQGGRGRQRW